MKKFILKSLLWLVTIYTGTLVIFYVWGIELNSIKPNAGIWIFGAWVGFMAQYLGNIVESLFSKKTSA
ncbi:hypothetical protein IHV09_21920 [Fictibacillus sp. 23RED33]|uniref:hypothetical protein n=1 Tax=Fictibacillus sp. 23RED33 TaxID=2745879 RepID=UPI0018CC7C8D|nr:hypothetical protein [Fictibacillus sp. 23RED33]MBH0176217.1 hypothetical protein [Fictibacillus sp. 23RED33]